MAEAPAKVGRVAIYQSDAEGRCIFVNAAFLSGNLFIYGLLFIAVGVLWLLLAGRWIFRDRYIRYVLTTATDADGDAIDVSDILAGSGLTAGTVGDFVGLTADVSGTVVSVSADGVAFSAADVREVISNGRTFDYVVAFLTAHP